MRIPGRDVPYVPVISLSWFNDRIQYPCLAWPLRNTNLQLFVQFLALNEFKNRAFILKICCLDALCEHQDIIRSNW